MNFLRKIFEETGKFVEKGKPLSWAYPVWEAADTIFFQQINRLVTVLTLEIIWILKGLCFLLLSH